MHRIVVIFLTLTILVGCGATGPKFTAGESPEVGPNEVLLVVYRPETVIGIGNFDVPILHLDDRRLTRMRIGGHIMLVTSTGRHILRTTESLFGKDTDTTRGRADFEGRGGGTVYFRYTESFESIMAFPIGDVIYVTSTGKYIFDPVSEAVALQELLRTRRMEIEE